MKLTWKDSWHRRELWILAREKMLHDRGVGPQSFSFSKKRSFVCAKKHGEMGYEGSPVTALPNTRRRMTPPRPQQISFSPTDERQWQADLEAQRSNRSTRERRVVAAMENYLDKSDDMKVKI